MGITKQRLYYWEIKNYASLPRKAVCDLIVKAKNLFNLKEKECGELAASAGISLTKEDKSLYEVIFAVYSGSIRNLCNAASIDERAFRNYKYKSPSKQILLAVCTALGFNAIQTDAFISKFGYCLSESVLTDIVAAFYLRSNSADRSVKTLNKINETLYVMGIPTLGMKNLK